MIGISNWRFLASAASAVLMSAAAQAQATAPNSTPAEQAAPQLGEIIVTAQRRSENVQRAALAVDVVSTDKLALVSATRASDLVSLVPALQIGESGQGQQSLYLRGVGTFSANSYSDPAVAFNVDGVAIGRPSSMSGVLYDLARVEVLKGPQGTLYGRNATGGAINIVPNAPKLGDTSGYLTLALGTYAEVHPEGAINVAVSDNSAARLAFTYLRHDGYQTDGTGDADNYAFRGQYLIKPSSDLSIRLAGDYAHDGGHNAAGTLIGVTNPFTGVTTPSPFSRDLGFKDPRIETLYAGQYSFLSGRFGEGVQGTPRADANYWGALAEIIWHTPIGTLTVLPSHRDARLNDYTSAFGFGEIVLEHDRQTSVEARLAGDDTGLIRWLAGAYYFRESIHSTYQYNQITLAPIQNLDTGTESKAGFGRLTIAPIDNLRFTGGIRYTDDHKYFNGVSQILLSICTLSTPIPACPNAPLIPDASSLAELITKLQLVPIIPDSLYRSTLPGAATSIFKQINIPINQTANYSKITWHAGVEYDIAPDSLLYGSADTGYHAGGFAFALYKPTYDPEVLTAYSIGSKNRFFQNKLQLNLELFYWKYANQQISHGAIDTPGNQVFVTDNAGSSTIKGAEVSVRYLLGRNTTLSFDAQYVDAKYDRFIYTTPAGGTNGPPVTSCPFVQTSATVYTINCAGKQLQQTPKWAGNFGLQHVVRLDRHILTGEVTTRFQSSSSVGFELVPVEQQNSFTETSIAISVAPTAGKWSATAFVNNLENNRPLGQSFLTTTVGIYGATVAPPRTAGVRFSVQF